MQRSITLNMGMRMNGWYDLKSLDPINEDEDEEGLKESLRQEFGSGHLLCVFCLTLSN